MSVADHVDAVRARFDDRLPAWITARPVVSAVVAVTVAALALRLFALGARTPHYDESRVAFWALYLSDTGYYEYHYITHGPFLHVVGSWIFGVFGATDFTMRLPVALVGGLLPLSALVFRRYISRAAVVGLAGLLALDPTLLYFSRFFRNDVLVATFAFVSFGLFIVALHRRRPGVLVGAAFFLGLAFTPKENAILYPLCWIGAAGLVLVHDIVRPLSDHSIRGRIGTRWRDLKGLAPADGTGQWSRAVRILLTIVGSGFVVFGTLLFFFAHRGIAGGDRLSILGAACFFLGVLVFVRPLRGDPVGRWGLAAIGAVFVFLGTVVFFYAPRGSAASTVGFWESFARPRLFPTMVGDTLFETLPEGIETWTDRSSDNEGLIASIDGPLGEMSETLALGSSVVATLGVAGFLYALYDWLIGDRLRPLALAGFYWAAASLLGYPLAASVGKPSWLVVHVVVPLALPAALAVAVLARWGKDALADDDVVNQILVGFLLAMVVVGSLWIAHGTNFERSQAEDNVMVQYAQPGDDMSGVVSDLRAATAASDGGTDVLVFSTVERTESGHVPDAFVVGSPGDYVSMNWLPVCSDPANQMILASQPLPWYFASEDATVTCTKNATVAENRIASDAPPMVVTHRNDHEIEAVRSMLSEEYRVSRYNLFVYENTVQVWVRSDIAG